MSEQFIRPRLLEPAAEVGFLGGAAVPADLYFVSRTPSIIIGMGYPARIKFSELVDAGVAHIVCLTDHDVARYDPAPLRVTAVGLQDLWHTPVPDDISTETQRVNLAADAVIASVLAGEGVAVHCHGGRGRTGTVLGVALVRLGHDPELIVTYFDALHKKRGKGGWPESSWQAEVVRAAVSNRF